MKLLLLTALSWLAVPATSSEAVINLVHLGSRAGGSEARAVAWCEDLATANHFSESSIGYKGIALYKVYDCYGIEYVTEI